jgi:hypothetical protein
MKVDDFKDSDKYQDLLNNYYDRLETIVSPGQKIQRDSARPAAAKPAAQTGPFTTDSLKKRLQSSTGFNP